MISGTRILLISMAPDFYPELSILKIEADTDITL